MQSRCAYDRFQHHLKNAHVLKIKHFAIFFNCPAGDARWGVRFRQYNKVDGFMAVSNYMVKNNALVLKVGYFVIILKIIPLMALLGLAFR